MSQPITSQSLAPVSVLVELHDRVITAEEPSRELDCAVGLACGLFWIETVQYRGDLYCRFDEYGVIVKPGQAGDMMVPYFTKSVDAALLLLEKMRPGWVHYLSWLPPVEAETGCTRCTIGGPDYISDDSTDDTFEVTLDGLEPQHALAVVAALLESLIAEGRAHEST